MISDDNDKVKQLLNEHAVPVTKPQVITTNHGVGVTDTDNSLTAGERGPLLMEDFEFRDKITHFDHERIPERVVHARGAGAHGYFELYESQASVTKAQFLNDTNTKTPVFIRFSTVLGSRGSADTVRDVRGFATRFYTKEGNFDLVANNIPVFFIQDAIKFPDIVHAGKPEPIVEIPQAQTAHDNFWDFISLTPESMHMIMWTLSDRAIPRSYRMMQGFGVNTFVLVNEAGERRFVKFHIRPILGTHGLAWDEALKLGGQDPDFHRRDLYDAIDAGVPAEYEFGLQIVEEKDEHSFDFDILDATKIIPEELVPVKYIGKIVLNRKPNEFFTEVEQIAFCTQNIVPGIDFSNDPLLQGRNFSYLDTQLTRLGGPNFFQLPINRPICPVFNNQRDGFMRQVIYPSNFNYFPNRSQNPTLADKAHKGFVHFAEKIAGMKERMRSTKFKDHYTQARMFFKSLSKAEQEHLIDAARFELGKCEDVGVRERMIRHFTIINPELAAQVAPAIGIPYPLPDTNAPPNDTKPGSEMFAPSVSMDNTFKNSIKTRKIAWLLADGFNATQLSELQQSLADGGAMNINVSLMKNPIHGEGGGVAQLPDQTFLTCKSTYFDAIAIVGGAHVKTLSMTGSAIAFVNEAFKHFKPILALGEAVEMLRTRCQLTTVQLAGPDDSDKVISDLGVVTALQYTAPGAIEKVISGVFGTNTEGDKMLEAAMAKASTAARLFAQAITKHRHWDRDVSMVAA